jgi:outer membrane lipoprotein SlyB
MKKFIFVLMALPALLLTGCMSNLDQDTYSRSEARTVQTVMMGQIISLRPVNIEGSSTPIGALAGAGIGGVAGSAIGGGRGSILTTIVGAVGGGLLGYAGEKMVTSSNGVEITLRLDDGSTRSIVQQVNQNERFTVGDRVRITGSGGNYRVIRSYY